MTALVILVISMVAGAALVGAAIEIALRCARTDAAAGGGYERLVLMGRSFRCFIVGISAMVAAFGFFIEHRTLALLSVTIGLQELYESSVLIRILEAARREEERV
jgi:hypothetical protein